MTYSIIASGQIIIIASPIYDSEILICSSGASGMWPTDASGPTDYSVMNFRHWPESVCSHWISPATRFPPLPSETTILRYPELSHWLGRTTGPWRLESKAITYMERIRSLLTYVAPAPRVLVRSATSTDAMEESLVYEEFLSFFTRHFLEKACGISWVSVAVRRC